MTYKEKLSWEETILLMQSMDEHRQLIKDAYLTDDLIDNCERFSNSAEFENELEIINKYKSDSETILDIPGGNGLATYAFAKRGYRVTTVEPDASNLVGRGAIKYVLENKKLVANVVDAYGEDLPFADNSFDVVFVRQGLHHARDLVKMISEYYRVLKRGGILLAAREHVVDNYEDSLKRFLDSQADHKYYGGENAFTLNDYLSAIENSNLKMEEVIYPYDSMINIYPLTIDLIHEKIMSSKTAMFLNKFLNKETIIKLGMFHLKRKNIPGRLHTFVARKT